MGASGGVRGVLGASRDSRYSGTRRGIGDIRGHWGILGGVGGCLGASGIYWEASSDCRYSGTRRGIGGIGGSLGCRGHLGASGGCQQFIGRLAGTLVTQGAEGYRDIGGF